MSDAFTAALALLARRAMTRHEVEERLRARGHDDAEIQDAVSRLEERKLVDDARLARDWIETQGTLRGRERILSALEARGLARSDAESAWDDAVADGAVDVVGAVARAVRRRLGPPRAPVPRARLARVYNALLHEGFEPEAVATALEPYGFERTEP